MAFDPSVNAKYTVDTPNDYGTNGFTVTYTDKTYWDEPGYPVCFESTQRVYTWYTGGTQYPGYILYPGRRYFASTVPGVVVTCWNVKHTDSFAATLDKEYDDPISGTKIYYDWTNTYFPYRPEGEITATPENSYKVIGAAVFAPKTKVADPQSTDPYVNYGEGDLGGDTLPVPSLPTVSAVNTGLITLYNPTESEMRALSDYLWTNIEPGADVLGALKEIAQSIARLVADPLKVILGLSIVPSQGLNVNSTRSQLKVGFTTVPGVFMHRMNSQYYQVDCGELTFNSICGDTFLDYSPYAKFQVYLPFIGIVHVDANDFVNHTIGIKYNIDALSGACTAFITKDGSVMYTYSGNVALNVPLSAESWSETWSAALNLVSSSIKGGVAGVTVSPPSSNPMTPVASGLQGMAEELITSGGAANLANNPSVLSPSIERSGAVAGSSGFMNIMIPFVVREAVRYTPTDGMNTLKGYPLHSVKTLGTASGYTEISGVHLENIPATTSELVEIENLLVGGVIL